MLVYRMPLGDIKIGDKASYFKPCHRLESVYGKGEYQLPLIEYRPKPDGITRYRSATLVEAEMWYYRNISKKTVLSTQHWIHSGNANTMEVYEKMASWNHAIDHNRDRLFIRKQDPRWGSNWEFGYIASNYLYSIPAIKDYPIFTKAKGALTRYYNGYVRPIRRKAVSDIIYASNYGVSLQDAAFKDQAELFGIFKGRHPDYYGYAQYELIDAIVDTKLRPYYGV